MALSTEETARLAALKAARAAIIDGKKPNKVQSGGRLVEFGPGDLGRLEGDIERLELAEAGLGSATRRRGSLRFRIR